MSWFTRNLDSHRVYQPIDVRNMAFDQMTNEQWADTQWDAADRKLAIVSKDDLEYVIFKCRQTDPSYKLDLYDCNKFTIGLISDVNRYWPRIAPDDAPLALGYAWVEMVDQIGTDESHALCWALTAENELDVPKLRFIEPQTDLFVSSNKVHEIYRLWV